MELSIQMLHLQYPVKEIATILGYENHSKFTAKFKKTFGVIPSKYI